MLLLDAPRLPVNQSNHNLYLLEVVKPLSTAPHCDRSNEQQQHEQQQQQQHEQQQQQQHKQQQQQQQQQEKQQQKQKQ
jgi:hypothetical protein